MTDKISWLQPGPPDTLTGGFIYNRRIIAALNGTVRLITLPSSFPEPTDADRTEAAKRLAALADGTIAIIDGLALGVLDDEVANEAERLCLIGLIHHPLALETGLSARQRRDLVASEKRALSHVRHVVVTSRATAADLAGYEVANDRIDVVEPGTEPAPLANRSAGPPVRLLCIATLTPRKGHADLIAALGHLTDFDWVLDCYGSLDRDRACADHVRHEIGRLKLTDRVTLHGERSQQDLADAYANADLMVLPSFHEGYGMALAEALARGVPVVSTTAGAIPDTVPPDAGLLVPPGDSDALEAALRRVLCDPALRDRLAAGAARARRELPTWATQAARFADILERIAR